MTAKQLFERVLSIEDDDLMFWAAASGLPQKRDILDVEKKLGVPLSSEHRALMETFGCFVLLFKPEAWPEPRIGEVRPMWQFLRGIEVFGTAMECPDELDVLKRAAVWCAKGGAHLVPAIRLIGGRTVVGYGNDHALVEWEMGGVPRSTGSAGLIERLDGWITELLKNKERFKAERSVHVEPRKPAGKKTAKKRSSKPVGIKTAKKMSPKPMPRGRYKIARPLKRIQSTGKASSKARQIRSRSKDRNMERYRDPRWVVELYDAVIDGKRSCIVCSKPFTKEEIEGVGLTGCRECKFRIHDACSCLVEGFYYCKNHSPR